MAKKKIKKKNKAKSSKQNRRVSAKTTSSSRRMAPTGIKIISILGYIGAVLSFVLGLFLVIGGIFGGSFISSFGLENMIDTGATSADALLVSFIVGSVIFAGIIFIIFGIIDFLIARGLWRGRNWARIITVIFMAIGFISSVIVLDFLGVIITGIIGYYLWFSKTARSYFR